MKEMKRILSLVLCFVMVVGLLPMSVFATDYSIVADNERPNDGRAENDIVIDGQTSETGALEPMASGDPIYVLAGGDFQAGDNGKEDHYYSRQHVANILAAIDDVYSTMDGFIFVGDYDGDTHNDSNAATGIAALMDTVDNTYSNLNHDNTILLQGNHESNQVAGIDPTGGYDFDGYAVYVMNQADYCERQTGKGTQIQTVANNLETWLNNKLGEGYSAPIFVTAHVPLAYGTRTYTNGDGLYAKYVFDVINTAAANGLNIIFLHGHDHAYGADNYLGGEAIYLPKGDKINICVPGDNAHWTEETLNFTYMNAGYVGYYNENYYNVNSYEEEKLTMTVFKIENNQVTVERYSKNGLYNLKSEGREGFYANGGTCAGIGLAYNTAVYSSPQTISLGIVEDLSTIGEYIPVASETPADDVKPTNNGWVEVVAPVPGTPEVPPTPASTKYVYTLDTDGTVTDKADAEQGYLIVGSNNDYAMTDSLGRIGVTITDNAITLDAQPNYEWWITADGKITDGTNYLRLRVSGGSAFSSPTYTFEVVQNASEATAWEINYSNNGNYTISYDYSYSSWGSTRTVTYYLRYNSNAFSVASSSNTVRLFSGAEVTTPATDGTPAVPGTNGTYYKISGALTYDVEIGTSQVMAEDAVKGGITVYKYEGMEKPGDDVTGTAVADTEATWTLDSNYSGSTAGDYALTISKDGKTLGVAEVVVPPVTTYYIAEGNGMYFVHMNTTADAAMAVVKAGVTVSSATSAKGANKTAVSDDEVTWNWIDKYDGADSGPYTVEILYDGTSLGTVEVKVNVKFETGLEEGWIEVGESEGSGGTHTYTLDTNGIDAGSNNKYIIVARNAAYLLDAGSARSVTISSDGKTATTSTRDYEYYFTGTTSGLITRDGTNTLYQQNWGIHTGYIEDSNLDRFVNNGSGYYRLYDGDGTNRSLYYDGSSWTVTNTNHTSSDYTVRLYKYTGTTGGTPAGKLYAKLEGETLYTVEQGTSATEALNQVKEGITGWLSSSADGANATEIKDSDLKWTWKNTYVGTVVGSYWVEISYNGVVLGMVEVKVEPGVINHYPEYPDEGAVQVDKTATGIDFQSSGVAQVEISASGVPVKKGVDLIVMVDTSSSMSSWCICGTQNCTQTGNSHKRRSVIFEASLENLIAQLQAKGDDGQALDIRVAIADFNGFNGYNNSASYGSPYDRDEDDTTNDTNWYSAANQAKIYTGDHALDAGAFVNAADLPTDSAEFGFNYVSGTNYDYAFDAIYQLGHSIKSTWTSENERDLFVIFMSDGAPMQYNYYHSQGQSTRWQYWLTGTVEDNGGFANVVRCQDHIHYYDESNGNKHRMAEAVKGSPNSSYEIIRKNTTGLSDVLKATGEENMYMIPGLGATMFSIAFDPVADGNTPASAMIHVLEDIASEQTETTQYYYLADSEEDLSNAFKGIGATIAYAANNARFVDQMGSNFNLQMTPIVNYDGDPILDADGNAMLPSIEIISYDIYTKADAEAGLIPTGKNIGDRKGTFTVLETVTFSSTQNADGSYTVTGAYSDQIGGGTTNILADGTQTGYVKGVIYAKTFIYNTNSLPVEVNGVNIPTGEDSANLTTGSTAELPAETFYWKMGTVQSSELAMRYYVYLDGSMEGERAAGSYATNNFATLYYDNYLGAPCYKDTVSPVVAWESANVSYAFYLVNEQGQIIVNQTTGETGTFANKIAVTDPVVYEEILLNNTDQVQSIDVKAISDDVLPKYYTLYDEGAVYTIHINSDATGNWKIDKGSVAVNSTYVTHYTLGTAYSNTLEVNDPNYDYTHTVVWFAVVWKLQAHPDSVVIDFGLPVDITVMANDMFGTEGKLAGIGPVDSEAGDDLQTYYNGILTDTMKSGFSQTYTGQYGVAQTDLTTGKIRYTPNSMIMNGYDRFAYAVQYSGKDNPGYYYDVVTVIPATTIYYEDDYVTLKTYDVEYTEETCVENSDKDYFVKNDNGSYTWVMNPKVGETYYVQTVTQKNGWPENSKDSEKLQEEDRPGQYSLGTTDANNPYGYDGVYDDMSSYSMGHAAMIDVSSERYGTAEFSFWGTGFDVISMTSNSTGVLLVDIYKVENGAETKVKSMTVDTYYGYTAEVYEVTYTKNEDGEWELEIGAVCTDDENITPMTKDEIIANAPAGATVARGYQRIWILNNGTDNALYQVPVINADLETYAQYKVVLTAMYFDMLNHTADTTGYNLYLDAIRIYNPAGKSSDEIDDTIESAYSADGELFPKYYELRNMIIDAATFDMNGTAQGVVFIDGASTPSIENYTNYGPNNELYLASGQSIAFSFKADPVANYNPVVRIGLKTVGGTGAVAEMWNVVEGKKSNTMSFTLNTATDMFYDITALVDRTGTEKTIVITNSGTTGTILSITDIKVTYKPTPNKSVAVVDPSEVDVPDAVFTVSKEVVEQALATLPRKVVFIPVGMETVDQPIKPIKPLKPTQPGKPAVPELPELPTDPIKPIRSIHKAATAVSFEQTVVRNRRVLG